jgi:hypothetical protein
MYEHHSMRGARMVVLDFAKNLVSLIVGFGNDAPMLGSGYPFVAIYG